MKKRLDYIDFFRGLAIINMIIYHTLYDLKYVFDLDMEFFSTDKWYFYQQYICISFIFLSGLSTNFTNKILKNAFKLMCISLCISIITIKLSQNLAIYFGVLHFLSFSMFAIYLYSKIVKDIEKLIKNTDKLYLNMFISTLMIFIYLKSNYFINSGLYKFLYDNLVNLPFSYILGFPESNFYSADYFPIIPWIFLSFSGYYFGKIVKDKDMYFNFDFKIFRFVRYLGRNSLKIYVLHQVYIYIVLYVIFSALR